MGRLGVHADRIMLGPPQAGIFVWMVWQAPEKAPACLASLRRPGRPPFGRACMTDSLRRLAGPRGPAYSFQRSSGPPSRGHPPLMLCSSADAFYSTISL